jgi:serine protease Do
MKDARGALVSEVTKGGPAEQAGIRRKDIVVEFNGKKIDDQHDLPSLVAVTPVGEKVKVKALREGVEKEFTVAIGELKDEGAPMAEADEKKEDLLGMATAENDSSEAQKLGVSEKDGVTIVAIRPDGPAAESGMQPGDVIKEINNQPVKSAKDYSAAISKLKKGKAALFLVKRGNNTIYFAVKI